MADITDLNFNANNEEGIEDGYGLMDKRWATFIVSKDEKKQSKKNPKNYYLNVTLDIMDSPNKGRKMWVMFNLWNESQECVDLARRQFGALCRAIGIPCPKNTQELHNQPFGGYINIKKNKQTDEMENVAQNFVNMQVLSEKQQSQPVQAAPQQQQSQGFNWDTKAPAPTQNNAWDSNANTTQQQQPAAQPQQSQPLQQQAQPPFPVDSNPVYEVDPNDDLAF